jgi:hypothetical protein
MFMVEKIKKHYLRIVLAIVIIVAVVAIPYQIYQSHKYDRIRVEIGKHLIKESVIEEALATNHQKGKLVYIYDPATLEKEESPQFVLNVVNKYNVDFMVIDINDKDALNFLKVRTDIGKLNSPIYVYFDQTKTYISSKIISGDELIKRIEDSGVGLIK